MSHVALICSICKHASRSAIEQALGAGRPLREIVEVFGTPQDPISKSSIHRHRQHVAAALQELSQTRGLASAGGLITLVESLIAELQIVKRQATSGAEVRKSVEVILKAVATLADLCGAHSPKQVNVSVQAQVPTPQEAISWSQECLLVMLDAQQMRSFASELLARAQDQLLIEGDTLGAAPNAPPQLVEGE